MDFVGYAIIRNNPTIGKSAVPIERFIGNPVRVFEFGHDGCVMVIDPGATGIATFDKEDIVSSFKCGFIGDKYLCPPGLDRFQQIAYMTKLETRKGGYNDVLRRMTIAASLHCGKFNDDFLWQVERSEQAQKQHEKDSR